MEDVGSIDEDGGAHKSDIDRTDTNGVFTRSSGARSSGCAGHRRSEEGGEEQAKTAKRLLTDFLVFVSYSWSDAAAADDVTAMLESREIQYVQDREAIDGGEVIGEWVEEQLRLCSNYLLILSEESASSNWCTYEFGVAVGAGTHILVYIIDDIDVPPFAARAAVRELRDLDSFFSKARIDVGAVDEFIAEALETDLDRLRTSVPRPGAELPTWDAANRWERAGRGGTSAMLSVAVDRAEQRLTLEWGLHDCEERREFWYEPGISAVCVTPGSRDADWVGVREPNGHVAPAPANLTWRDEFRMDIVCGWEASPDFWRRTLERLLELVPADDGAAASDER